MIVCLRMFYPEIFYLFGNAFFISSNRPVSFFEL